MNSNSIYSYFLLSKTWDLDFDILQLVKKWLEPHLKRRMLNGDYNLFMYIAESNFIKNSISLKKKKKIMLSRYGFKNNVNTDLKLRINTFNIKQMYGSILPHSLYEIHNECTNYKIFGIKITIRDIVSNQNDLGSDAGVTDYTRNIFIINFRFENPKIWDGLLRVLQTGHLLWSWPLTLCEQKIIMRNIMDKEEEIITNIS